jgi:hypothetical protein
MRWWFQGAVPALALLVALGAAWHHHAALMLLALIAYTVHRRP